MRIELLFGFLGSGKTTLASRVLKEWGPRAKLALIVNEFGDVGVDGEILRGSAIDMVELSSGCLCCTLKGSLVAAIAELGGRGAEHIVIEATGVASPEEMLDNFTGDAALAAAEIGPITTVVDASKFLKIRDLLGEFYESQIVHADLLVLNKLDLVTADLLDRIAAEVSALNPDAAVRFAERCDLDLDEIMAGPPSRSAARLSGSAGDETGHSDEHSDHHAHDHSHNHAPAQSFVADVEEVLDERALRRFMSDLPDDVWRAKGFVKLAGGDHLLQYAMGELELTPCAPRQRHYLVFIGRRLDASSIRQRLTPLASAEVAS
jgi:G3E family GTPase